MHIITHTPFPYDVDGVQILHTYICDIGGICVVVGVYIAIM